MEPAQEFLQEKKEAVYSVHWSPRQKVEQCTQYIRCPGKKWSNVLSTLVVQPKSEVMYTVHSFPN